MGSTFKYIEDGAMFPCGGTRCHHCERDDIPIYNFRGKIVNPERAKNPQLATDEPEVSELCADCILSGNIRKGDDEISRIHAIAKVRSPDLEIAIENYHAIPHIPLMMQDADWPMCCDDWCEFTGIPQDYDASALVPSNHQYWDHGPAKWGFDFELRPESLREVSAFRCLECDQMYFIWQPT